MQLTSLFSFTEVANRHLRSILDTFSEGIIIISVCVAIGVSLQVVTIDDAREGG